MNTNRFGKKIHNLFSEKIGEGMNKWNMSNWEEFGGHIIGFSIEKPNFRGTIAITECASDRESVILSFKGFGWETHATTFLKMEELAVFVDKLGNEPQDKVGNRAPIEGQRAPQDNSCCGQTYSRRC